MTTNLAAAAGVTTAAGQSLQPSPLSSISGALQSGITDLSNVATNTLNRFFPPERRAALQARLTKFASEKPYLASFLLSQIALSGLPIALFAIFTLGVGIFALLVALLVAVLGAVLFTVFMAGVALLVLLPTLFITTFSAAFIWLWGVGLYYFIKWFNEKPVPGVHTSLKDGLMESTGLNAIHGGFTDAFSDQKMPGPGAQDPSRRRGQPSAREPQDEPRQKYSSGQQPSKSNPTTNPNSDPDSSKPQASFEEKDGADSTNTPKSPKAATTTSASTATGKIKSGGPDATKRAGGVLSGGGGIQGVVA